MHHRLLVLALVILACSASCKRTAKGGGATDSHSVVIAEGGLVLLDGKPAGTTRAAAELARMQEIDELETKTATLKRDLPVHFEAQPDTARVEYMSVLATLGLSGFPSAEIKTSQGLVIAELPKDSKQRESQAKENHAELSLGGNDGAKLSFASGQIKTDEILLGAAPSGKALSDKILSAWKAHADVSVLYFVPISVVSFSDFGSTLQAADEARHALGRPARIALAVMSLDAKVEPARGSDPLAFDGFGQSDGGRGEGIGLGSIGTLGGAVGRDGGTSTAKIRTGATTVNGRLPPEVVQRIVRQNFGRFRLCYEQGLERVPDLKGEIAVKFVIGRDGSIAGNPAAQRATVADDATVKCVLRAFSGLAFPSPEGGIVTVVYPLQFEPPAAAPK
jgi:hypothetical protein